MDVCLSVYIYECIWLRTHTINALCINIYIYDMYVSTLFTWMWLNVYLYNMYVITHAEPTFLRLPAFAKCILILWLMCSVQVSHISTAEIQLTASFRWHALAPWALATKECIEEHASSSSATTSTPSLRAPTDNPEVTGQVTRDPRVHVLIQAQFSPSWWVLPQVASRVFRWGGTVAKFWPSSRSWGTRGLRLVLALLLSRICVGIMLAFPWRDLMLCFLMWFLCGSLADLVRSGHGHTPRIQNICGV